MIQALSYSLNFYRNLQNRGPQFTLIFHMFVPYFFHIPWLSHLTLFHRRLQVSAYIWSYLILICMEIIWSPCLSHWHIWHNLLRLLSKGLKTGILSKKINQHVDGQCYYAVSVYKLHSLFFFFFFPFSRFEGCSLHLWCLSVFRQSKKATKKKKEAVN